MATLTELQEELSALKAAKLKILTGAQEYSGLGKISVKRADLSVLDAEIQKIEHRIEIAKNITSRGCALSHSHAVFSGRE